MDKKRIILLCDSSELSEVVYNYIDELYGIDYVIVDNAVSKSTMIKRRAKKLGWLKVIGQLLFILLVSKPLSLCPRGRIQQILRENGLSNKPIPEEKRMCGYSINDEQVIQKLKELNPDLILVNGTRIISKKVLQSVTCSFINMHVGITPKYRGVHGMYWALVNRDYENCGVTVHYIDEHIDTGDVIYQATVTGTPKDNFCTYPYLQVCEGARLFAKAIEDYFSGRIKTIDGTAESHLWSHPTLWQYLRFRIGRGVK